MKKRFRMLLFTLVLGLAAGALPAQEGSQAEEMRFVHELRKRHYVDLALEYLLRLEKTGTPALQQELPLELAKTRLEAVGDESNAAKRLVQYQKAQQEFQRFLTENANHSRAAEVKLDLARVVVLQGRAELSLAWQRESLEARVAEGLKARATFLRAGAGLQAASTDLAKALDAVKDSPAAADKARALKLQDDFLTCELEKGLNLFDLAQTYLEENKDAVLKARGQKMQEAQEVLDKVAAKDDTSPICWQAKAWVARCYHELGEPKKARQRFNQILASKSREAADGQRLARYFRLLVLGDPQIDPEPEEKGKVAALIIDGGTRWLRDYAAFRNTDEANGLRFLLARIYLGEAKNSKLPSNTKKEYLESAGRLLTALEGSENEYSERARQLTIGLIKEQGGFTKDIAKLNNFQECFVRAQFEIAQLDEDAKNSKSDQEQAEKRKSRLATINEALSAALSRPDAKNKRSLQIDNARAILAFYALQSGDYRRAIEVGEGFARLDPRAPQAGMAAVYSLQAYSQSLGDRERKGATSEEIKVERDRMLDLARYMKERWPNELAGNAARHQLGLLLLREKNLAAAIKELSGITREYPSFTISQSQLAEACMQAERDKLDPIPGDKADGYRGRAIAALESIPNLRADTDPTTSQMFMMSRLKLLQEWFKAQRFKDMQTLADKLLPQSESLRFNDAADKNVEMKDYFKKALGDMRLYALYGLAQTQFDKRDHAAVAALLDPVVDEARTNPDHQLVKNQQLGNALLSMDLRSNVQLGRLDRAGQVVGLLRALAREAGNEAGTTQVLRQLVALMQRQLEETGAKDEAELIKMRTGFTAILDDLTRQAGKQTPEFVLLLAQNYATMGEHKKAASLLEKVAEPPAADVAGRKPYQAIRLLLARQLRLSDEIDKSRAILYDEILGKDGKGWGSRNVDAFLEEVQLLEKEGNFALAAQKGNRLVQQLIKKAGTDNALKEKYLEAYYHVVYCFFKHGEKQTDAAARDKYVKNAANQMTALEKRWPGFGSDASNKRFQELLRQEPALKTAYDTITPGQPKQ